MKNLLNKVSRSLWLMPALVFGLSFLTPALAAPSAGAVDYGIKAGTAASKTEEMPESLFGEDGSEGIFKKVVNIMLFVIGAVAVIMLIYGGVKYVTSGGAQDKVAEQIDEEGQVALLDALFIKRQDEARGRGVDQIIAVLNPFSNAFC